jgi:predicted DNA-binding transcriptional regulator YafY
MAKYDSPILAILTTRSTTQKWMTTPEIAEALRQNGLRVDHVKSVQRRLEVLVEQGVAETRQAGNALEWKLKPGASGIAAKGANLMTFDEALALQILRRFASRQIPTLVGRALEGLFDVAKARLDRGVVSNERQYASWNQKVAVVDNGFAVIAPAIKETVFQTVSQALFTERLLEIVYRPRSNPDKNPKPYNVMPLGLVEAADLVYLVAKTPDGPVPVMYRLDRMESAKLCLESFVYPEKFSLSAYIKTERKFEFFPQGHIKVVLRFVDKASHAVIETPISKDQEYVVNDDESITVRATVMLSDRFHWWLRSFGPYVEVLEPADLRQRFVEEAKLAKKLYGIAG